MSPRQTPDKARAGAAHAPGGGARRMLKTLRRMLSYLAGGRRVLLFVAVLCILLSSLVNVAGSLFLRLLIDGYIAPLLLEANPVFTGLLRAILVMGALYLTGALATLAYSRLMVVLSQDVLKRIRDEMFNRMQELPIRYFDTHTHGDIMSHYINDADTLRMFLSQSVPSMLFSAVTIVAVFFAMLYTSVWMTLVVAFFIFLIVVITKKIGGNSAKFFMRQQNSVGVLNGYAEELINGQKVVKVFCYEERAKEGFDRRNEELRRDATSAHVYTSILMPIMMNLGHLQYVVLAVAGGALAIAGVPNPGLGGVSVLTLGAIASFLQLSRSFNMPINQISQQVNAVVMALAGAERIFEMMDEEPERDEGYVTLVNAKYDGDRLTETEERTNMWAWKQPHGDNSVTYTRLTGDVRFFDVDFGYTPEELVLHNVELFAKPGQKIAFVGATGAGKTTITNLINRFYDLADGKIRYDGININKIRKGDLRRSQGYVLQDVNLFTETVRENIRYGNLDATDEEVEVAARLAGAHDFITRLPQGYDTLLDGDGGNLSQGQRQLLAIARCAVADPPVMILDEATSSIDTRTEAIVQRGMNALMQGRTVFIIAHRLSTVRSADVILVLELGRVIERGSHEELLAARGKYYQLYTGAFELE